MANSFNIDVKPEIAALEAKVDIIDTEVDTIRATDLPAIDTLIDTVDTEVDSIRSTDLPAIDALIDTVDTEVDAIRVTDLPAIDALIDIINAKILDSLPYYWNIASDSLIMSADTERTNSTTSYVKVKEIKCFFGGIYRIKFDLKVDDPSAAEASGRIYKSGAAHGTEQTTTSKTYVNYSEDLVFSADDLIQLYIETNYVNRDAAAMNFRIYGTLISTPTLLLTD